jgi:hypothetical protein
VTITVFSGGAGCGKTYQLMQRLAETIVATPPKEGQKVLALTFMHGARRRLDERLTAVTGLGRRYECSTLDSFAARIVRRWQSLAVQMGARVPAETEYDETVAVAATLLADPKVVLWVKASFPILVLDEAQDLTRSRLDIVRSLATALTTLIAADEFQCLDATLRPNPAWEWLKEQEDHTALEKPMRTTVSALLEAATAVRAAEPVHAGKGFSVNFTPKPAMAGGFLNTYIAGLRGSSVAVITPSIKSFAEGVVAWTSQRTNSKGRGPYPIVWEQAETKRAEAVMDRIVLPADATCSQALAAMEEVGDRALVREVASWLDRLGRTRNKPIITREVLAERLQIICANQRRFQRPIDRGLIAMSVHGAKNREFENVVVLWPAAVAGDDDQKRRLLYNAITRAKSACLVLVQLQKQLGQPPFA